MERCPTRDYLADKHTKRPYISFKASAGAAKYLGCYVIWSTTISIGFHLTFGSILLLKALRKSEIHQLTVT